MKPTIGLLKCDPRPFEALYAAWLPDVDWRIYNVHTGELPASPGECAAWIGTGSSYSVYDDEPWIHAYAGLVRRFHAAASPFAGVCFGHQMIGHALGGRVARSERGWCIGIHQFTIHQHAPWMEPRLDTFGVVMSCQDQVERLPPGATLLAGNQACPAGMFQLGSLLAIQGHPEYTPEYSESLMLSRIGRIGPDRVRHAQASLTHPRHPLELAAWVRNFLGVKAKD